MLSSLQMLVVGLYVFTSILGLKVIHFGPTVVASGVLFIAVVKPLLDIICEVWGPAEARSTVIKMSVVRALVLAGAFLVSLIPAVKEPIGFGAILAGSIWLFLFGVLAELIASVAIDIPVFMWLKKHTKQGFLVRQYLSNVSLVIQSLTFSALYHLLSPEIPFIRFFLGQFVALAVISSLLAPLASLVVRRIKR